MPFSQQTSNPVEGTFPSTITKMNGSIPSLDGDESPLELEEETLTGQTEPESATASNHEVSHPAIHKTRGRKPKGDQTSQPEEKTSGRKIKSSITTLPDSEPISVEITPESNSFLMVMMEIDPEATELSIVENAIRSYYQSLNPETVQKAKDRLKARAARIEANLAFLSRS